MFDCYMLYLLLILFCYVYFLKKRHPVHFPPHPALSLPFIGDLWFFKRGFASGLRELKLRHGDIFGFLLGSQRVVVLCNYDLILEAGRRFDMSGRIHNPVRAQAKGSEDPWDPNRMPGVLVSQGQGWIEQRKFMMQKLKIAFTGLNSQGIVKDGINDLCKDIESSDGKPIDYELEILEFVTKMFIKVCVGDHILDHSDILGRFMSIKKALLLKRANILYKFISAHPKLATQMKLLNLWGEGDRPVIELLSSVQQVISQILTVATPEKSATGFIDLYLEKMKEQSISMEETSFVGKAGHINLANAVLEIILAGIHAPVITIKEALTSMILYPEVQEKVHQELDSKIGKGVQACISDRKKTPYVQSVLTEVSRLGKVIDQSFPHRATEDCYLSTGHYIPKDTMIIMWLGEVMTDAKHFHEPELFHPERFLDHRGSFVPNQQVIPFGLGKRRCPGELVSQELIYLVFTGILSKFKIEKIQDNEESSLQLKFIPR